MVSKELPPLDDEDHLVLVPEKVPMSKEKKLRNRIVKEYLIQWKGFPREDANWEGKKILQHPALLFLKEKYIWEGRTVMSHQSGH